VAESSSSDPAAPPASALPPGDEMPPNVSQISSRSFRPENRRNHVAVALAAKKIRLPASHRVDRLNLRAEMAIDAR